MTRTSVLSRVLVAVVVGLIFAIRFASSARADMKESDVPATSVTSGPATAPPAATVPPAGVPAAAAPPPGAPPPAVTHKAATHHATGHFDVEPANARLKVIQDVWIYSEPSKTSTRIEQAQRGKFVNVSGSTHDFLQVQLKSGKTGYISPDAVDLVKPTDKVFVLTTDTAVRDKPNQWSRKVSEVHRGHNVHIVGIALNYMRIRMKNGTEGYIPTTALQ